MGFAQIYFNEGGIFVGKPLVEENNSLLGTMFPIVSWITVLFTYLEYCKTKNVKLKGTVLRETASPLTQKVTCISIQVEVWQMQVTAEMVGNVMPPQTGYLVSLYKLTTKHPDCCEDERWEISNCFAVLWPHLK